MPVPVLRRGDTGAEISLDGASLGWVIGHGCEHFAQGVPSGAARSRFFVNKGSPASLHGSVRLAHSAGFTNRGPACAGKGVRLAQVLLKE